MDHGGLVASNSHVDGGWAAARFWWTDIRPAHAYMAMQMIGSMANFFVSAYRDLALMVTASFISRVVRCDFRMSMLQRYATSHVFVVFKMVESVHC